MYIFSLLPSPPPSIDDDLHSHHHVAGGGGAGLADLCVDIVYLCVCVCAGVFVNFWTVWTRPVPTDTLC